MAQLENELIECIESAEELKKVALHQQESLKNLIQAFEHRDKSTIHTGPKLERFPQNI